MAIIKNHGKKIYFHQQQLNVTKDPVYLVLNGLTRDYIAKYGAD
jgi:hypothetical protein